MSGAERVVRGRILTFTDDPAESGASRARHHRGRRGSRRRRADRRGRGSARNSRGRAGRRADRRSYGRARHARADRRPYPLSADAGDRLVRRATARLAAQLHLRRGAAIRRSGPLRARRCVLSRRAFPLRHHDRDGLLHRLSAVGRGVLRRSAQRQRAHDRRQGDDRPQRARRGSWTRSRPATTTRRR